MDCFAERRKREGDPAACNQVFPALSHVRPSADTGENGVSSRGDCTEELEVCIYGELLMQ